MNYSGVIFDMDGVLFDTEKIWQDTWKEIAGERGITLPEEFKFAVSGSSGELMHQVVRKYYQVEDGTDIINECVKRVRERSMQALDKMTGADEILAYFKSQGKPMVLASSNLRPQIEFNLKNGNLTHYFNDIICGAEVAHGKPAPDIFLAAAKKINCDPKECLVFEDSKNGVRAGIAAGCMTIMVPDLVQPEPELAEQCLMVADNLLIAMEEIKKK